MRLLIDSFPVEMLREELRNSHDEGPAPTVAHHQVTTFDLPLTHAAEAATGGEALDAAALRSLRGMFLLLDEWDCRNQHTARDSSEEYVAVLDTEIP
ncbi:MAG: hypothetical protein WB660_21160 [Candidatus Sulfotelmatobacter sp.]